MKKFLVATLAAPALVLGLMPAASATLPPCPASPTIESLKTACELPAYPEEAQPAVNYLTNVIDLVVGHYATKVYDLQHQVAAQAERLERKQARIERLKAKIRALR